jgi:hypothetical protein
MKLIKQLALPNPIEKQNYQKYEKHQKQGQ